MGEEIIEEKSKLDMVVEALSKTEAPVIVFLVVFITVAILLYCGKIDQSLFKELILSGALVSAIIKLTKSEK